MDARTSKQLVLCDELRLKIFSHLSLEDLMAASLVCREFNALAYDDSLIINQFPIITRDLLNRRETSVKNLFSEIKKHHRKWGAFFKLPGNNYLNCLLTKPNSTIETTIETQTHLQLLTGLNNINYIGIKMGQMNEEEEIRIEKESYRLYWGPNGHPLHQLIDLNNHALGNSRGIETLKYITLFTNEVDDVINWLTKHQSKFSSLPLIFVVTFNKDLASLINQTSSLPICEVIEFNSKRECGFFWQDFVEHLVKITSTTVVQPDYAEFSPVTISRGCVLS